ncbi:MAG TPA: iron ABC transporter permease [Dongiaceae bacterium]|nr:iron ABC transporter permease [Dongiaceae bacterium]
MAHATTAAAGRRRPLLLPRGDHLFLLLVLAYVAVIGLWPLLRLFSETFTSVPGQPLALLQEMWSSRSLQRALANTITASLGATLIATVIGTLMALVVGLTNLPGKSLAVFIFLLPLLIPPQITAMAWTEFTGSDSLVLQLLHLAPAPGSTNPLYSGYGIMLVMGIEHAAIVFLTVRASLRTVPRDLIEAAQLAGAGPKRITRTIILPVLRPAVLSGAALAFVSAIGNFGVPALLGIPGRYPMLTTLVYQQLNGFGPSVLGSVSAVGLLLVALAAIGLGMKALLSRRPAPIERGAELHPFPLGGWLVIALPLLWLWLAVSALMPLLSLIVTSFLPAIGVPLTAATATFDNYRFVLLNDAGTQRAFVNSFALAAAAGIISAVIALPLGYFLALRRSRLARTIDLLADAPYAVPGIVLAIGVILVLLPPLPYLHVSLYGTIWIILIAYLARSLPLALRPTAAAFEQLDRALDEAGQIAGAGLLRRLRRILMPSVAPSLVAGAILVFMIAFTELTVSALLWSTGHETLGVVVFMLHGEGNTTGAAALAVLMILVITMLAFIMSAVSRWLPKGVVPWQT